MQHHWRLRGMVGGRLGSQKLGGRGSSPAVVFEPLPALPAPPASAVQIHPVLTGAQDQPALVHQNAAEADPSHVSETCMIVYDDMGQQTHMETVCQAVCSSSMQKKLCWLCAVGSLPELFVRFFQVCSSLLSLVLPCGLLLLSLAAQFKESILAAVVLSLQ